MEKKPLRQLFLKTGVAFGTLLFVASCQHVVETNDTAAQPLLS
jgi:hypothetical protein